MNRILLLLTCLSLSSNVPAEIYKWVDDQGRTHYGDKPVDEADSLQVDVSKKGHMESSVDRAEKGSDCLMRCRKTVSENSRRPISSVNSSNMHSDNARSPGIG